MADEIFSLIGQEQKRQQETLQMIPSENIASKAVREAVGSVLMNKYAEGQVGKRYYQGNAVVDEVEALCKQRALDLFGLDSNEWGVNVQALSGSPANLAIYNALLEPGDKIMSMYLPDGGHLSHGWELPNKKISIVSKFWQVVQYKTDPDTKLFDYKQIEKQAWDEKPKMIVSGGTAYPQEIDHQKLAEIAHSAGAFYLADVSHEAGLVAAGVNKTPFEDADVVMMTTHKTLRGPRGAMIFSRKKFEARISNIETNSNALTSNNETIDLSALIDASVFPGIQGGPHLHTIAGIAVALAEAATPEFNVYAAQVIKNAQAIAAGLSELGLDVVSGGTAKHLVLVDLRSRELSGWVLAWALEMAGMIMNRNTVPWETASPFYPSGIRMGTPVVTTRGMKEAEMKQIVGFIGRVLEVVKDERLPEDKEARKYFVNDFLERIKINPELLKIKEEVRVLCGKFPIGQGK
jgi:glycine hydroxymethyltransferase